MRCLKSFQECISHQKPWFWFLIRQGHPRSNLTVPIESPWLLSKSPPQPRICHRFQDISSQRILTLTFKISRSSKVKPMGSLYNLRWVQNRKCHRSSDISRQKVWSWFLTPSKITSDGASRKPVGPTYKCCLYLALYLGLNKSVPPRFCRRFKDISNQRIWHLTPQGQPSSNVMVPIESP